MLHIVFDCRVVCYTGGRVFNCEYLLIANCGFPRHKRAHMLLYGTGSTFAALARLAYNANTPAFKKTRTRPILIFAHTTFSKCHMIPIYICCIDTRKCQSASAAIYFTG